MRKILLSFIIGAFAASAFAQNPDYYVSYDFCQSLTFKNDTSVATENFGDGYTYIAPGVAPSKNQVIMPAAKVRLRSLKLASSTLMRYIRQVFL